MNPPPRKLIEDLQRMAQGGGAFKDRAPATPKPGDRIRLGVDVNISHRAFAPLAAEGVDVVYVAPAGERDDIWFAAAREVGVHAIVSQDMDLAVLCYNANTHFLHTPNRKGLRWRGQIAYILYRLGRWGWR